MLPPQPASCCHPNPPLLRCPLLKHDNKADDNSKERMEGEKNPLLHRLKGWIKTLMSFKTLSGGSDPSAHKWTHISRGAGIAQWLERRTRDWKVAGSNPCRSGGRIFFSRVDYLCWLLFRYPFHPRVTAVARKRSRSFCQVQVAGYS